MYKANIFECLLSLSHVRNVCVCVTHTHTHTRIENKCDGPNSAPKPQTFFSFSLCPCTAYFPPPFSHRHQCVRSQSAPALARSPPCKQGCHIRIHMYTYKYVLCIYIHINMCYVCIYMCVYICIHEYTHKHIHKTYLYMWIFIYVQVY